MRVSSKFLEGLTILLWLPVEPVLPFTSVLIFCLTSNMSDKEELSKLRGSHKVYRRRMESLETEIQALLRRFDIQNEEHRDELRAYQTKFGLCWFTIHDPTIHNPTMHDSCINYTFPCMPINRLEGGYIPLH